MGITTDIDLLRHRRTKIVATLGPASRSPTMIRQLIRAGANVIRLNMSHGDLAEHQASYQEVRRAADELGQQIAVFADLCGPKIRVGKFDGGGIDLRDGESVVVTTRNVVGRPGLIPSQYDALAREVGPGSRIMLNDGSLELRVDSVAGSEVQCTVVRGGPLKNHKGMNLPGTDVSAPALTDKDREDARFALGLGVDYLALSFVRSAEDVLQLRTLIDEYGADAGIIAKIERPEALHNATSILEVADAIMVARGDLGVELNLEQVPIAQIELIARARAYNRPVIVATQMLESMIDNSRPTRAEVSDVAHAVSAGADAVMLSGETAAGRNPVESVTMMARIIRQTEAYHFWQESPQWISDKGSLRTDVRLYGDAVAASAARLTHEISAKAIIVVSQSGRSAVTVCARRPSASIVGVTSSARTARRMGLMWGLLPVVSESVGNLNPNHVAREIARSLDLARSGDYIVLVRGFHSEPEMNTPSITMLVV